MAEHKRNFKDVMHDLQATISGKEKFVKARFQGILWTELHRITLANATQIDTGVMPACQFRWMLFRAMADRLNPGRIPEDADPFMDKTTLENRPTIDFRSLLKVVTILNDVDPIEPLWKMGNVPGLGSPVPGAFRTSGVKLAWEETYSLSLMQNHLGKEFDLTKLGELNFLSKRRQTIVFLGQAMGFLHPAEIKPWNNSSEQGTSEHKGRRQRRWDRGKPSGSQQRDSTRSRNRYPLRSKFRQAESSNRRLSKRSSSTSESESEYEPRMNKPEPEPRGSHATRRSMRLAIRSKKESSSAPVNVKRTVELKLKVAPSAIWYTSQAVHQSKSTPTTNAIFIKNEETRGSGNIDASAQSTQNTYTGYNIHQTHAPRNANLQTSTEVVERTVPAKRRAIDDDESIEELTGGLKMNFGEGRSVAFRHRKMARVEKRPTQVFKGVHQQQDISKTSHANANVAIPRPYDLLPSIELDYDMQD
ncbi:hypothetical protein HD806DRAFT_543260 [Xylariaceae sp. AK1471]|nr:hypothetical protein HD806DRAFT_543260 [Xylariaceae sp. AK1471]